jgi:hypothetical protein
MILSAARFASGLCNSSLPLPARVRARRKARTFYGDTSISGRAGTFRRATRAEAQRMLFLRRLCDAGPRF